MEGAETGSDLYTPTFNHGSATIKDFPPRDRVLPFGHRILFPARVRRRANKHAGDTRSDIQYPRLSPRESLPGSRTSIRRIQFLRVPTQSDIIDTFFDFSISSKVHERTSPLGSFRYEWETIYLQK